MRCNCFVTSVLTAVAATTADYVVDELEVPKKSSEIFYDNLIIKFNKNCITDLSLTDYYRQALLPKSNAERGHDFAAVDGEQHSSTIEGVDPNKFSSLLESRLIKTRSNLSIKHSGDDTQDAKIMRESRRRRLSSMSHEQLVERSTLRRKLAEVDSLDREEDILASLHILAATRLVGTDKAEELLEYEEKGDVKKFNEFLSASDQIGILSNTNSTRKLTEFESLDFLGMHVVKNDVLKEALHPLAKLLPCLAVEPEPDSTKEPLGVLNLKTLRRRLGSTESAAAPTSASTPANVAKEYDVNILSDKDLLNSTDIKTKTVFIPPNDPHFDAQWYLKGQAQSETFGSYIVDGWSSLIRELTNSTVSPYSKKESLYFTELLKAGQGMDVAVLDSGCSQNPDLINQFWRNKDTKGCNATSFVGEQTGSGSSTVSGDCIGYDFGNNQPDPTREISTRIHGSSTAGLIAAEANNDIGISGICPYCKIICLKIYDSDKQRITMTSVVRALDYIGRKNIKLSNHSYGGFGASQIERSAHEALTKLGHLSVCSSGNNACNIDGGAAMASSGGSPAGGEAFDDPKVCKGDDGKLLGPFTPATYDVPGIFSIGGTTKTGEMAWFSNYGANSVDVFAPGDSIVTLYGPDQLASVKGTSFSSPIVAGMAAVLWSAHPELTNLQIKQILMTTGTPIDTLQGKAREGRIVSLARALASDTSSNTLFTSDDSRAQSLFISLALVSSLVYLVI